jgi:hypothetical protein
MFSSVAVASGFEDVDIAACVVWSWIILGANRAALTSSAGFVDE